MRKSSGAGQGPGSEKDGEDAALESYLLASRELDGRALWLLAVVPAGWLVLGTTSTTRPE
ncbi:MAG: hypothetical protein HY319_10325 [Armatimonadetes bacterium]|nr:hypothetical protein [Armatimonadota bacterium]